MEICELLFDNIGMNNNTFKSLFDLGRAIKDKAELIGNGKYSLKEIESALLDLNELQERFIVLKYKAIEQLASQVKEVPQVKEPEIEIQESQEQEEKKESVNVNQMTIMDGISQVEKEASIEMKGEKIEESIAEKMQSERDSIAEKMENKAINEIKSAISINQRFSYTKNLFGDNAEVFNYSLQRIEESASLDEANQILQELEGEYNWDLEDETVLEFQELVNRRFGA